MFGCHAVYIKNKIVFILRDRDSSPPDNGVWLATTIEHHASLKKEFPPMRSIKVFDTPVTGWQVLPVDNPQFEKLVMKACALVLKGDPRIGKIPKGKSPSKKKKVSSPRSKKK